MTPVIPCNLCNGKDTEIIAARDREKNPMQTVICTGCGLVWTDPRPSAEETKKFYAQEYRQKYKSTFQPKLKHVYRDMKRAVARYERIKPYLQPGFRVLDIGAGAGFFPYVVKQNGFEISGLEPNEGYARYANDEFNLDVKVGFIQDINFEVEAFDIVTLNHVLEHLEDPGAGLARIFDWLKPGGYLNVEVPNIEATYHAPGNKFHLAHLYTFNPENLKRLGEKAGFAVTDLKIMPGTEHINYIFQKPSQRIHAGPVDSEFRIDGNYNRIRNILDAHTPLSHYLSATPYTRFIKKNSGYLKEQIAIRGFASGRELADNLIARNI